MGDPYWNRQGGMHPPAGGGLLKRPRSDYDLPLSRVPLGYEVHNYLAADDTRGGSRMVKDTETIGSAYDRYLQSSQLSLTSGEGSNYGGGGLRAVAGGMPALPIHDSVASVRPGIVGPDLAPNRRRMGFSGQLPVEEIPRPRETLPLPPDASSTLYIEGLPSDSTKREVAHIFRPFVGYKEVRLVTKESKHRGGDPLILCFVDFADPACAATALSALQGYKMDELDRDSSYLRLQFSKFPGPRSGGPGFRGKR
ncbi:hypothetical protein ACH5RR_034256 [Cinchona calisaya]|uniref:RRM domain-containing protein n=1 Tax=Cinchona calisaya TaxID=153742 RepID=A0ABD2YEX4_9GENT